MSNRNLLILLAIALTLGLVTLGLINILIGMIC